MPTRKHSWEFFAHKVGKACGDGRQKQKAMRLKWVSMNWDV